MENINLYIVNNWKTKSDSELSVELNISENAVRKRRNSLRLIRVNKNGANYSKDRTVGTQLQKLLEKSNINLNDIDEVKSVKTSNWNGFYKDKNGDAQTVDLKAIAVTVTPKRDDLSWPVVQQVAPKKIDISVNVSKAVPYLDYKTTVVLPDIHFGFRLFGTTFDPMHDVASLKIARDVCTDLQPQEIIINGDLLDFAQFSKYEKEISFQQTLQPALDAAYEYILSLKTACPKSKLIFISGNHDIRIEKWIQNNAAAAFGIRKASIPNSWPVLTLPYLLRFDELNIEYISGWPNGEYWINNNLKAIHGVKLKARQVADDEQCSVIMGHAHRIAVEAKTRKTRNGYRTNYCYIIGTLARTDGCLPSRGSSLDSKGYPVSSADGWQRGFAVVSTHKTSEYFTVEQVCIEPEDTAVFRGITY